MIVVTGPGRSGTSFVAALYRDLGFDPGGRWAERARGGLEAVDVVRANVDLLRDLGMGAPARRFGLLTHLGVPREVRAVGHRVLPPAWRVRLRSVLKEPPWRASERFPLLEWEALDAVVERHRDRLLDLAGAHAVVKDPRFCWTLPAWVAAGAPIEHLVVCTRPLEAVVSSRVAVGWLAPRSRAGARNWFAYGLGLCVMTAHDARLGHRVVRFPDFLDDPAGLYRALRFPAPVDEEAFREAFRGRVRRELVHDPA